MFSLKRLGVLLVLSLLITIGLYYLDTDPPSDDLFQRTANWLIVLIVITIFYAGGYGLLQTFRGKRG